MEPRLTLVTEWVSGGLIHIQQVQVHLSHCNKNTFLGRDELATQFIVAWQCQMLTCFLVECTLVGFN